MDVLNVGENQWGLRDWYSVDDIEENRTYNSKFDILDDEDEEDKILNYWVMTKWMMTMTFRPKRMIRNFRRP